MSNGQTQGSLENYYNPEQVGNSTTIEQVIPKNIKIGEDNGISCIGVLEIVAERIKQNNLAGFKIRRNFFTRKIKKIIFTREFLFEKDDKQELDYILRYTLDRVEFNTYAACRKIIRGIALRKEGCNLGTWLQEVFPENVEETQRALPRNQDNLVVISYH